MIVLFLTVWAMIGALWLIPALVAKFTNHPKKTAVYWLSFACFLVGNPYTIDYIQLNIVLWICSICYVALGKWIYK